MKKWVCFAIVLLMVMSAQEIDGAQLTISDVSIIPAEPTALDLITINIDGGSTAIFEGVVWTEFTQISQYLFLDLYCDAGVLQVPSTWSYSEPIGTLPEANYELKVSVFRTYLQNPPALHDTYETSFTVVPEPGTIGLLALGALALIRRRR